MTLIAHVNICGVDIKVRRTKPYWLEAYIDEAAVITHSGFIVSEGRALVDILEETITLAENRKRKLNPNNVVARIYPSGIEAVITRETGGGCSFHVWLEAKWDSSHESLEDACEAALQGLSQCLKLP